MSGGPSSQGQTGPGSSHGQKPMNHYGGAGNNEFLLESQKIIYAPPSRQKSNKQTERSPMRGEF